MRVTWPLTDLIVPSSGFSFRSSSVAPASLQLSILSLSSFFELPLSLCPPSVQGIRFSLRSSDDEHSFFLSLLLTSHRSYINDSRHVAGSLLHALEVTDSLEVGSAPNAFPRVVLVFLTRLIETSLNRDWKICKTTCKSLQKFTPSPKGYGQEVVKCERQHEK